MKEELTTAMHYELLSNEVTNLDLRIMGVYGAISRGVSKHKALLKYGITEELYDNNIDEVLNA